VTGAGTTGHDYNFAKDGAITDAS